MSVTPSALFKIAGIIFLGIPVGHTQMYNDTLAPGLVPLGNALAAYAAKVSWNQANGYFLTTGKTTLSLLLIPLNLLECGADGQKNLKPSFASSGLRRGLI